MPHWTVITASKEQQDALLSKHLKPFAGIGKIISKSYHSADENSNTGYVTLKTVTGKRIEYQLYKDSPVFVQFTGFGDIRYDVPYPEKTNQIMFDLLRKYGNEAKASFWKGAEI